jgi:hypothetical protein
MDPVKNPYAPGAGTFPPYLAGREEELQAFETLLARLRSGRSEKPILLVGLRGVGKTVLLEAFSEAALQSGWVVIGSLEPGDGATLGKRLADAASGLLPQLVKGGRRLEGIAAAIRKLEHVRIGGDLATGSVFGEVGFHPSDREERDQTLAACFLEMGRASAEADTGCLVLLDELQELSPPELEALVIAIHGVQKAELPVAFVGAGLPSITDLITEGRGYAERMFEPYTIGSLDRTAAQQALVLPARELNVRYTRVAVTELLAAADLYPYFIQEYGKAAWNLASGVVIRAEHARNAIRETSGRLDTYFFSGRANKASPKELELLSAMAHLRESQSRVADVIGIFGAEIDGFRSALIKKGLLYAPERGYLAFTTPRFGDYMRRRHPWPGVPASAAPQS